MSRVSPGLTVKSLRSGMPRPSTLAVDQSMIRYGAPGIRSGRTTRPSESVVDLLG